MLIENTPRGPEPEGVELPQWLFKPAVRKVIDTLIDVWLYSVIFFALWFIVF